MGIARAKLSVLFSTAIYNRYNMDRLQKYKPSDKMIDLISIDSTLYCRL